MTSSLLSITFYSLLPALGMILGGVIASLYQPGVKLTSATQHFAAGVVFAAVAKELLPKLGAYNNSIALVVGFSLGVILMLALKNFTSRLTKDETQKTGLSLGLISAVAIDLFIDGILIGLAFLAGTKGGLLVAVALAMEILFLGLSTTATLGARSVSLKTRLFIALLLAFLIPIGSILGSALLSQLSSVFTDILLAFGVAALLYLVTEELLVEAHEEEVETPLITACFFLGFLCILLLENFAG